MERIGSLSDKGNNDDLFPFSNLFPIFSVLYVYIKIRTMNQSGNLCILIRVIVYLEDIAEPKQALDLCPSFMQNYTGLKT
jgi:hypothetical protein